MDSTAEHIVRKKVFPKLIFEAPFFANILLQLPVRQDPACKNIWTDGRRVAYSPQWVRATPLAHVVGSFVHAILHLACSHHLRRGRRDETLWNAAGDQAIDHVILDAGFSLPHTDHLDPRFKGQSAEAIYSVLKREGQDPPDPYGDPPPSENRGEGQGSGPDRPDPNGDPAGNQTDDRDADRNDADRQDGQDGTGGSGPVPGNDAIGNGEVRDMPAADGGQMSPAQQKIEDQNWQRRVVMAANAAKAEGRISGGLDRLIRETLEPKVGWREELRRFMESTSRPEDYDWNKPSRRYLPYELYVPAPGEGFDVVTARVFVDTSGSIGQYELDLFAAEVSGILEEFKNVTVTVDYFDTRIDSRKQQVYHSDELPVALKPHGGGGTDFVPIFERVEEDIRAGGEEPKFVLIFSDLCCSSYPEKDPSYPVLWAKFANPAFDRYATRPRFGKVIEILDDGQD